MKFSIAFVLLVLVSMPALAAPVADAGPDQNGVLKGTTVNLDGSGSSDALTYAWTLTTRPASSSATLSGSTTVSPSFVADEAGTYVAELIVNDGTVNSAPDTVTITVVNQAPVLTAPSNADKSVDEGATLDVTLSASDGDGDALTWTTSNLPGFCGLTDDTGTTGNLQCTPGFSAAGTYNNVTVTVSDGNVADDASVTFRIIVDGVNQAPVLTAPSSADKSVNEGATLNVALSASDPDSGDTLSWTSSGLPSFCSLTDSSGPTGNLQCTPGFGDAGTSTVTVTVSDDGTPVESDAVSFDIVVGDVNQAPVLTAPSSADKSVNEGATLNVALSASDPDSGDTLSWTSSGLPSFCSLTDSSGPTGNLQCTPGFGDAGTSTVTVTVSDDGTPVESDAVSFDIVVGDVNQAPVLTAPSSADKSVNEGATLNVALSASDPDSGDTLSWTSSGLPSFCSLTDSSGPTGNLQCTPGFGDAGTSTVTVTVSDDGTPVESDAVSFDIVVGDVNQAPVLTAPSSADKSVNEGATLNVALSASDPDSGDTLSWTSSGLPSFCSLTDSSGPTGNLQCTPGFGDAGTSTVTVTVSDDGTPVESDAVSFDIVVGDVNQAPVLTAPSSADKSVNEGATLNVALSASDPDSGDTLSWTSSGLPSFCSLTDSSGPTGNLQCTPGFGDAGTSTVTVTVSDDGTPVESDAVSFDIVVGDVNQAPVLTAPSSADKSVNEGATLNVALSASDPDSGDTLSWTSSGLPSFCSLTDSSGPTGNLQCTPGFGDAGTSTVTVTVSDDGTPVESDAVSFDIVVGDVNQAPVLTAPSSADKSVNEGATLNVALSASDPDSGDTLSWTSSGLPSFCSLTDSSGPTGNLQCTPGFGDAGTSTVTVTVSDDGTPVESDAVSFDIVVGDVNQAPVLTAPSSADKSVNEGATLNVALSASDPDSGDTLSWTSSGLPSFCSLTDSSGPTGNLQCTPGFDDAGTSTVTVTVSDDGTPVESDAVSFDIVVGDVNQAPVLTAPSSADKSVNEGATLNVALSASDPDSGDTLSWTSSGLPSFCSLTDSSGPTGNLQCTPGFDDAGTSTVTVTVSDDGTPVESDAVSFDIVVGDVNQAPVLTPINNQSVDEGATLNVALSASDPDSGDTLTYTASGLPSFCSLTDNTGPTGNLQCSPGFDDAGTYPVTITVGDGTDSDSDGFNIVVGDVNRAPVLTPINNQSVDEGATLNVPLSASDPDSGDTLTYTASGLPSFCSLTDNTGLTGNLQCSPGFDDAGTYPVTITVSDGTDSDSDGFNIVVSDVNRAPVAGNDNDSTPEDTPVTTAVLSNDNDADTGDTLSITVQTNVATTNGSVSCTSDNCTYTPDLNYNGGDSYGYQVCDDGTPTLCDTATVTITINPVNDAPAATPQLVVTTEDNALPIVLAGTDPEDDSLTFTVETQPSNGALSGVAPDLTYTPDPDFNGADSFTFTVDDGVLSSPAATVSITVNAENDIPTATAQSIATDEDTALPIVLTGTDPEGDALTFTVATQPSSGSVSCAGAAGADCTYTPNTDYNGADSFTFTATDGEFTSPAATISITVNPVNDAPTATPQSVSTDEDTALPIVLAGTDPEDDVLTFTVATQPANGTLSGVEPNITYTPNADFNGIDSFTFTVSDGALTSAEAAVTIDVGALNDGPVITAQLPLTTPEDTALTITLADLTVTDADSVYPDDFTLTVQDGTDYTRVDNTITPALDFNGDLTVPVTVNDGEADSPVFNLVVTVTPVNDAPVIVGQAVLTTPEDTSLTVVITDVTVTDPDNLFPDDFTLELFDGTNYTRAGNAITPDLNFNGQLSVPATVSDGELTSAQFILTIDVSAENDQPVLETPIEDQLAIEGTAFSLDVSGNFADADGDPLQFTASGLPASGNLVFDPVNGVISGTPQVEDARDTDPYIIIITATDGDPDTIAATDEFNLNISALDRANVSLEISVAPDPAMLNDELTWTFTVSNTVGPQIASNVGLTGSFVGTGLSISSTSSCTIQATVDQVTEFDCTIGSLAIGEAISVVLTTVTSAVGDVVAFATAANIDPLPLDPNLADNSRQVAVGVAEEFSNGAVEVLGNVSVLSMAAGDVNGDGAADLVVGTVAGQPIQIYLSDGFRDFVTPPISLPDTSANEGVALADFDNNGTLDLVIANGGGQPDVVYSNDGVGNFTLVADLDSASSTGGAEGNFAISVLPAPTSSHDVAVADFNSDGNMDIVIATIEGNPVYLGDGFGAFSPYAILGLADSHAIAVGDFDGTAGPDIVFANVGSDSEVWLNNGVDGFTVGDSLPIGDAVSVTVGEFGGGVGLDLAFGRVPTVNGDVPANPVLINNGSGSFGTPVAFLGTSATNDILAGDVDSDGLIDLVFINTSGVHQIWTATGSGFELHSEQIVDGGALVGVLTELGFTDVDDPGGVDLALGGALQVGTSVYLNDGFGNLGLGDAVPPVLSLNGAASVEVPANSNYVDAGAIAEDNIDGDISASVIVTSNVNTAIVGSYTVTYNVTDFAGNSATAISRTVTVAPAAGGGGGGGGGGATSPLLLALLILAAWLTAWQANRAIIRVGAKKQNQRGLGNA